MDEPKSRKGHGLDVFREKVYTKDQFHIMAVKHRKRMDELERRILRLELLTGLALPAQIKPDGEPPNENRE